MNSIGLLALSLFPFWPSLMSLSLIFSVKLWPILPLDASFRGFFCYYLPLYCNTGPRHWSPRHSSDYLEISLRLPSLMLSLAISFLSLCFLQASFHPRPCEFPHCSPLSQCWLLLCWHSWWNVYCQSFLQDHPYPSALQSSRQCQKCDTISVLMTHLNAPGVILHKVPNCNAFQI